MLSGPERKVFKTRDIKKDSFLADLTATFGEVINLNLGSGAGRVEGYINLDARRDFEPDIVWDLKNGLPFPPVSVDSILASHVLEHFSYHDSSKRLSQWIEALKPGGTIIVKCPDLMYICKQFLKNRDFYLRAIQLLYGGQTDLTYNTHFTSFDYGWLESQLNYHGCKDVKRRDDLRRDEEELVVSAVKR